MLRISSKIALMILKKNGVKAEKHFGSFQETSETKVSPERHNLLQDSQELGRNLAQMGEVENH